MLGSQLPNINNQSTLHLIVKIAQEKLFYSYENAHELYKVPTNKINRERSVNIIILMKSQIVKNMLNDMPEDIKLFSRVYADLVLRIGQALNEQNLTKSDLAQKLDKRPSEISKWLNGDHNFTLKSVLPYLLPAIDVNDLLAQKMKILEKENKSKVKNK